MDLHVIFKKSSANLIIFGNRGFMCNLYQIVELETNLQPLYTDIYEQILGHYLCGHVIECNCSFAVCDSSCIRSQNATYTVFVPKIHKTRETK